MPKRVDPEERRQAIAEAVYQVIGERGWKAVTLRDVASTAGISMGQVQHYFTTKTDMLMFALSHMRDRVLAGSTASMAALPLPVSLRDMMRGDGRRDAPSGRARPPRGRGQRGLLLRRHGDARYAELLRDGYARQVAYATAQLTGGRRRRPAQRGR